MLKLLHENYCLIRRILPHPVWFSDLTGIHPRVAGNVLSGTRKISVRHVLRITQAFGLDAYTLQQRLVDDLDPMSQDNLARQAWLRWRIRRYRSCKAACLRYPGLGQRTLLALLEPGAIVSPLMCELVGRHTGWSVPQSLLNVRDNVTSRQSVTAARLLSLLRLDEVRVVRPALLPKRTTLRMLAVAPEIRFADKTYMNFITWINAGHINPAIKGHLDWFLDTLRVQESAGLMSPDQARALRRMVLRRQWAVPVPMRVAA